MTTAADLVAASKLRRRTVEIDQQTVTIREPDAFEYTEYQTRLKNEDKAGAVAHLLQHCVIDADDRPLFTEDEAREVAKGSLRVAGVLAVAITRLIEERSGDEKKV